MLDERDLPHFRSNSYRYTMGNIITWGILRLIVVMLGAMFILEVIPSIHYGIWWSLTAISLYAFVVHPAQVQYQLYRDDTRVVRTESLCASCRHFDPGGVLCSKLDEHVTETVIPCNAELWEPIPPLKAETLDE